VMTKVNAIRKAHPALQHMHNATLCKIENEHIIAWLKYDAATDDALLMVVNLDPHYPQSGWVQIPMELLNIAPGTTIQAHDLLTDTTYNWDKEWNFVELNPHAMPFHLFQLKRPTTHGGTQNPAYMEQLPGRRPIAEALGG
jgi:starch synthase (maltosyl-transferring)